MSKRVEMVKGVVTIGSQTKDKDKDKDTIFIEFEKPVFVGRDTDSLDLMESIKAVQRELKLSDADILSRLESAIDLSLRAAVKLVADGGGKGRMSDAEQSAIVSEHCMEPEFHASVKEIGLQKTCASYREAGEFGTISKEMAVEISSRSRDLIKKLHETIVE
jgi:hypothetical protein